ncbi:ABC-type transport auxiliary lipoprotein family protein [Paraburkholderia caballeronis]|uniref:ABC-type transport auxiliary lipoprotein family protein n=1 Tax=Paraburkholderia caballeronis TaxID=416943 RepID=UPI001065E978|nr:ABC-type transport auxiliary lipoprotein family protein [Paraburkholderia caballeronis]TDV18500.1 cholesterol transport system auxiliary component [Paraburkholderia caballeronis]TDV19962.1 cholesterol transport system auxiliary component [Paraburkholderia caballeronis]TDV28179.1 cholesterol transport system auxiliary component [Paraburkholderia caballeronis]TDV37131.1 cholesterol transport system auxiliary component [Paraburkholderia caballeronis]
MSRPISHLCRAALAALVAGSMLAACAGNPAALSDVRYDLGPVAAAPASGALPPLKVLDVSAPPPLDNDGFVYRLGYASQRSARYANSRWTMSPARLLTQRLRTTLSSHATVLTGADSVPAPMLKIDLDQFEQVFDSATESSGVLSARATLIQDGKVIGQRTFVSRAPASTPDASGGARALAAASDELVGQIAAWLSVQAFAGTP